MMNRLLIVYILLLLLFNSEIHSQNIRINEFLSSNRYNLEDEDGDYPDWIEIKNTGSQPINLEGYSLSDDPDEIQKWSFPEYLINSEEILVVYASGKDRKNSPAYYETIIDRGETWYYIIPSQNISGWSGLNFNDSGWSTGTSGFGYGDNDDATLIPQAFSVYLRKEFTIKDTSIVNEVLLHMDYDDAFVAYLNDVEIARSNIGTPGIRPAYNETAVEYHEALMYLGNNPEKYEITNFKNIILPGKNILAIEVHNFSFNSSDFSAIPYLTLGVPYQPLNPTPPFIPEVSGSLHTNFRIDADGDSLYLFDPSGIMIHEITTTIAPPDVSLGFKPGNYSKLYGFSQPTPWLENLTAPLTYSILSPPVFSPHGGFHPGPLNVTISSTEQEDSIYYTLDGSEPTRKDFFYNGPIYVDQPLTIRAKCFYSGKIPGETVTMSYLPGISKDLPLVFISADSRDLFDQDSGIYVMGPNAEDEPPHFGANFWQDWEIPAHIEYYNPEENQHFNVDAGMRIYGNYSRQHPEKSLAVYARSEYGDKSIDAHLFTNSDLSKFEAIVLRNSGNEWFGQNSESGVMFRDMLMTSIARDLEVDAPAGRPVVVYLNGRYWGIHNLREKINEHFVADNHGYDPDDINLLEQSGTALEGTNESYYQMISYLQNHDLKQEEHYNYIARLMDIDEFIRYCLLQIYYYNGDWPGNNIKFWQSASENSRWRWIMFDTDFGFGLWDVNKVYHNTLDFATTASGEGWPNPPWSTLLLRTLLKNQEFKNRFANTFADHLNSTLLPDSMMSRINWHAANIENEMTLHTQRWGGYLPNWDRNVRQMENFAKVRRGVMFTDIMEKFNIPNAYVVRVEVEGCEGAIIQLNTIKLNTFPWSGSYFDHIPIELAAIPPEGYKFLKWEGSSNSDNPDIKINILTHINLKAIFVPIDPGETATLVINEIFYKPTEEHDPGDWVELYNMNDNYTDISGWQILDNNNNHNFIFDESTLMKPNDYLVVCRDAFSFRQYYPEVQNYTGNLNFGFSSEGDCIRLLNKEGELIDSLCYGAEYPWPEDPSELGYSLSLKSPELDNTLASNWFTSRLAGGSPGEDNETHLNSDKNQAPLNFKETISAYPNPFSGTIIIEIDLAGEGKLDLHIMDPTGRIVKILAEDHFQKGPVRFSWSPETVTPGLYLIRMQHSGTVSYKKIVYTKH